MTTLTASSPPRCCRRADLTRRVPFAVTTQRTRHFTVSVLGLTSLKTETPKVLRFAVVTANGTLHHTHPGAQLPWTLMNPEVPPFAAPLAALRDGRHGASHPLDRPVTFLVPDDCGPHGLARIELEGPRRMARALVVPFLAGLSLVGVDGVLSAETGDARQPVKVDVVLDQLMRAVADLPEGPAGWGPYNRLRRLRDLDADQCREYLRSLIAATVRIVPAYRPPTPPKACRQPRAPDEQREAARLRKATSRDAIRAREEASVRAWLAADAPLIGRAHAAELADEALAWIEYADAERTAVT